MIVVVARGTGMPRADDLAELLGDVPITPLTSFQEALLLPLPGLLLAALRTGNFFFHDTLLVEELSARRRR